MKHQAQLQVRHHKGGGQNLKAEYPRHGRLLQVRSNQGVAALGFQRFGNLLQHFHKVRRRAATGVQHNNVGISQAIGKPQLFAQDGIHAGDLVLDDFVGEPIRAGDTEVVPFAAVQFGLGSAGAMAGFVGGVGAKTVPLGVLIVEGDDVRVELLPRQEEKSSALMQQLIQGIIDRKVSFMVNGVNLGNAPGNVADLTPMITGMMGQTTVMVNGLNLGGWRFRNAAMMAPISP